MPNDLRRQISRVRARIVLGDAVCNSKQAAILCIGTRRGAQGLSHPPGSINGWVIAPPIFNASACLGALILPSLQSAISELQAPAWSCLAEPSRWPDIERERVFILLPCVHLRRSFSTSGSAPTFKKHLIRIGMDRVFFNQAMLTRMR